MIVTLRLAILFAALLWLAPPASAQTAPAQVAPAPPAAQTFSADQRREIEGIIRSYLIAHPEVLQDAMDALDKQQK